jgi:hypothetical protein
VYELGPPGTAEHDSSGLLLLSTETVHVKKVSVGVTVRVPPLLAVMNDGGPGCPAKVKETGLPPALMLPLAGLTVIDVTFPITVAVAVALRA